MPLITFALVKPYVEAHSIGVVWIVAAVVAVSIELAGALRRRPEATKTGGGSPLLIRLYLTPGVILLAVAPTILPAGDIHPPTVPIIAGVVVFLAGVALRVWAKVALGRYFTYTVMTSRDQPVITSGPYRYVRHPSYTGLMFMFIGVGAAWGNWLGLAGLAVMGFLGLRYRIYIEEKAMLAELGDRYRTYADAHKRLIPHVW